MRYVILAAMTLIAGLCAVLSLHQFRGQGIVLNNGWLYASEKERKAMDKAPYYRQSGVVFALLAAVFLCLGLEAWLQTGWLMWIEWTLLAGVLVYAIASTVVIEKRKKQ